jgi:hypothetical protein
MRLPSDSIGEVGSHEECEHPTQDGHFQNGHSDPTEPNADLDPLVLDGQDVYCEVVALIQQTVELALEVRCRVHREHSLFEVLLGELLHAFRSGVDRVLGGDNTASGTRLQRVESLQQVREVVGAADQSCSCDEEGTASDSQEIRLRVCCADVLLRVLAVFLHVLDRLLLLLRRQVGEAVILSGGHDVPPMSPSPMLSKGDYKCHNHYTEMINKSYYSVWNFSIFK